MPGVSQTFREKHLRAKCKIDTRSGICLNTLMETDQSDYFRVIISEDKDFDASKGSILEIIIEVPQKPRPRRRSEVQIPLIRLATRLMLERGLGTSSWSEKHLDVHPVKPSELPARGKPAARDGNLTAWIVRGP
jgi:hypothetical protein